MKQSRLLKLLSQMDKQVISHARLVHTSRLRSEKDQSHSLHSALVAAVEVALVAVEVQEMGLGVVVSRSSPSSPPPYSDNQLSSLVAN